MNLRQLELGLATRRESQEMKTHVTVASFLLSPFGEIYIWLFYLVLVHLLAVLDAEQGLSHIAVSVNQLERPR